MAAFGALRRVFGAKSGGDAPGLPQALEAPVQYLQVDDIWELMSEGVMWQTQPQLRTVVDFLARNMAQCALQEFDRKSDTNRTRVTDSPSALLLKYPNPSETAYDLIYNLVCDLSVYDRAYWYVTADSSSRSGWRITRIPPSWVIGMKASSLFQPDTFIVKPVMAQATNEVEIPADKVIYFHGWNPHDPKIGSSPLGALRDVLSSQIAAWQYTSQVWKNGGRTGNVITRPADAPPWSPEAKARFLAQWRDRYTGSHGSNAGGTPILEDGMTLEQVGFSAHDSEFIEASKLSLEIVCQMYSVIPGLITGDGNYSNTKAFKQMLYSETLGPFMARLEDRINGFLLPKLGEPTSLYVEFNIEEKLQGSFEDQAAALQMAVGRPYMTAAEARAYRNLPPLPDDQRADELITPLNVLIGGQASPQDTAPAAEDRTGPGDSQPEQQPKAADDFIEHFVKSARSKMGAGIPLEKAWNDDKFCSTLSEFMDFEHVKEVNDNAKAALLAATEASNAE